MYSNASKAQARPQGSIEGRAARVSLVNGLTTALSLVFQLVSVPVCLHYWGRDAYGNWLAVFAALQMVQALGSGFALYVGNQLNQLYHTSVPDLRRHLASAMAGTAVIASLQLLVVGAAFCIPPMARMLGVSGDQAVDLSARAGLLVLVVSWVLTGAYIGIVDRLYIPANLMHQAAWLAMALLALQFIDIMAAALLQLDVLHASILLALSQAAVYLGSVSYARRKLPEFFPLHRGFDWRVGLADLRRSLPLTLSNLVQQAATNGTVLLITFLGGVATVPAFTTVRTVSNLWTQVTTVLSAPLLPDIVRFHVHGEADKLLAVNKAFWAMIAAVVNIGTLLVYPLLPWVYGHWTGHAITLDFELLCLMLGSVVAGNTGALVSLHLNGINRLGIVLTGSVLRAVLCLGVGTLGYPGIGLAAFGLGALLAEVIVYLVNLRYFVRRELRPQGLRVPLSALLPGLLATGAVVLFFAGRGLDWWSGPLPWLVALVATGGGTLWGWKGLDAGVQARLRGLLLRLSPRFRAAMSLPAQPAVIIFRIGSIGDTVVALPCLHAIARQYPQARRILLTDKPHSARASSAESVLDGSGLIDGAEYFPPRLGSLSAAVSLIRRLRATGARTLVYLAPRTSIRQIRRDRLFFRLAGIRHFIGLPGSDVDLQRRQEADGCVESEARFLARGLSRDIPVDLGSANWDLRLLPAEAAAAERLSVLPAGAPRIALCPGAKLESKDWGESRWEALVQQLRERIPQAALVVLGAGDERSLAQRVLSHWNGALLNLCGELTPRESAAVLGCVDLLVCHDSGPMHLASTQGTPCVALFGNLNQPRQWFPWGDQHRVIQEPRGITSIGVDAVAATVEDLMRRLDRNHVAAIAAVSVVIE